MRLQRMKRKIAAAGLVILLATGSVTGAAAAEEKSAEPSVKEQSAPESIPAPAQKPSAQTKAPASDPVPAPEPASEPTPEPVPAPDPASAPDPAPAPEPESVPAPDPVPEPTVPTEPSAPAADPQPETTVPAQPETPQTQPGQTGTPETPAQPDTSAQPSESMTAGTSAQTEAPAKKLAAPAPAKAAAQQPGQTAGENTSGTPDVDTTIENAPKAGGAAVTEQIAGGKNTVQTPKTQENDAFPKEGEEETQETNAKNAIQKAVDAALKAAKDNAGTTELTITVEDGEYDGDIHISWDRGGSGKAPSVFQTLYILAKDSFRQPGEGGIIDRTSIGSGASGGAKVNGNIFIDGINVVLAGLYYSMSTNISVKDSSTVIHGTRAGDRINTKLDNADLTVRSGDGLDNIQVSGTGRGGSDKKADLDGGGGSDVYTVDVSAGTTVDIRDQDGGRVHLQGELKDGSVSEGQLAEEEGSAWIRLTGKNGGILKLFTDGIREFTDTLTNKPQVEIKKSDLKNGAYDTGSASFSDFIYRPSENEAVSLIVNGKGFLNFLIVDSKELLIDKIQAAEMNVRLSGKTVTVRGIIDAANLQIDARDDDSQISMDAALPDSISDKLNLKDGVSASVMDIVTSSKITLEKGSSIRSKGSVTLNAVSSQKNNLIPFVKGVNIINVKIGSAIIEIYGNIDAKGAVNAAASAAVNAAASNTVLADYYIPLAVGIIVSEAAVRVGENAVIRAGGDIRLSPAPT